MEQDLVYVISQKYLDTWAQPADTFSYLVPLPHSCATPQQPTIHTQTRTAFDASLDRACFKF